MLLANKFVRRLTLMAFVFGLAGVACSERGAEPPPPVQQDEPQRPPVHSQPLAGDALSRSWTGDFDGMLERRVIRVLTPYSRTHYFIDRGVPRGIVYESSVLLEAEINKLLETTQATRVHVVCIPTSRDALHQALVDGYGDIIAANVTITPERRRLVDFTVPSRTGVHQVAVTGPGAPAVTSLADLSGRRVAVREKSLQFDSLVALNSRFETDGRLPVAIRTVPGALEDEDILEMVSAGLLEATVADEAIATFWSQILPGLDVRRDVIVRPEGDVAWAVRKSSPKLLAVLNPIIAANRQGTLFGNEMLRRYLKSTKLVKNATGEAELRKFHGLVDLFRKYAGTYDLDYVLMIAQGYQESQLQQTARSRAGAVGVMQVMPATGRELKVGDIRQVEANVHAGVKYIRFMIDQYLASEPMDALNKTLFAFAAYNCGPARLRELRKEAAARGLDPNRWFNHVERIAGERVGREPVQYVSNIYKYYVAYSLTIEEWQPGH